MQRRKSKEVNKVSNNKKKVFHKKNTCSVCYKQFNSTAFIHKTLLNKYSSNQLPYYLVMEQQISIRLKRNPEKQQKIQQHLLKYYKPVQRRHQFYKVKQIYELHKQAPRFFMLNILQVLAKRHHRKRLLQYFKIAKILGLKITGGKTSTFLYSLSKTYQGIMEPKSYQKILGKLSEYQFSQQIQQKLIDALQGGVSSNRLYNDNKQNKNQVNLNPQLIFTKQRSMKVSEHGVHRGVHSNSNSYNKSKSNKK